MVGVSGKGGSHSVVLRACSGVYIRIIPDGAQGPYVDQALNVGHACVSWVPYLLCSPAHPCGSAKFLSHLIIFVFSLLNIFNISFSFFFEYEHGYRSLFFSVSSFWSELTFLFLIFNYETKL